MATGDNSDTSGTGDSGLQEPGEKRVFELFGGHPPPRTTRERLIETALDLFYGHGFHATGLDRILTEVGISKQAFYKHFESKDELAIEAIALRDVREQGAFAAAVRARAGDDPRAMLLAMFDVLDEWFTHPDFKGCIFLSACTEFPARHDPMHQAASRHYEAAEAMIRETARAAGADDPDVLARELVLLLEGTFMYRLVAGNDAVARMARMMAERILDERLGHGGQAVAH